MPTPSVSLSVSRLQIKPLGITVEPVSPKPPSSLVRKNMEYDTNNVFAKILRGEIPCKKVYENNHALAFHDIHPQAPVHILVIPKGAYAAHDDFAANATDAEIAGLERAITEIARQFDLSDNGGYRLISNCGANAGQEVPHYHVHILAGRALGPMLARTTK